MLRFPFALRFWVRIRQLGYLYVGLIVSLVLGAYLLYAMLKPEKF